MTPAYERIDVQPLAGGLGAEISGVDLADSLDDTTFSEVRRAFLSHLVVFFRDQRLTARSFADFARRFGPLAPPPYSKPRDDHPYVLDLIREADVPASVRNVGDRWHSDNAPEERPSLAFGLYCLEAPPYGGDTLFANMYAAYDQLSPGMQSLCESLIVMHSRAGVFAANAEGEGQKLLSKAKARDDLEEKKRNLSKETPHPLVRVHPETGRKLLYVTGAYSVRFQGMTAEESKPLIDYLNQHAVRPENTCRFRWEPGSLALMDNRCTQHYAVNDYAGFRRAMMRIDIAGDRPYGPATKNSPMG